MSKAAQIEIWIIRAKLFRNTKCMGKMSPYVNLQVGQKTLKSSVSKKGGYDPAWSDVFTCDIPEEKSIEFKVMDQGFFKNYVVGTGVVETSEILEQGRIDRDIRIYHKNKEAGFIRIVISCIADHAQQSAQTALLKHVEPEKTRLDEPMATAERRTDEFKLIDDIGSIRSTDSVQGTPSARAEDNRVESHLNVYPENRNYEIREIESTERYNERYTSEEGHDWVKNIDDNSTYSTLPMVPDPAENL